MSEIPFHHNFQDSPEPPPLPRKEPWNVWWTLLWGFLGMILLGLGQTVGVLIAMIYGGDFVMDEKAFQKVLKIYSGDGDVAGFITLVCILFVCPFCWLVGHKLKDWNGWEYLGNRDTPILQYLAWSFGLMLMVILFGLLAPYLGITDTPESMKQMGRTTDFPLLLFLGVALGAPLTEEFIFRGVLFRGLAASRLGVAGAILLPGFVWAVIHLQYQWPHILLIFLMSLILGLARYCTGSIWVPTFMHAINNGFAAMGMLLSDQLT